ncbi:DUF4402 domain-containing protein [Halomonas sp. LBP4]|uniref:DUF4402 domain-containing protein n=1 Tax=Halomonas sp. LBP4 TaxID=2044917 RepID=UPI000D75A5C1|nr:DUF4402 domain-containing protein [Halomonas sp. LBP4]PXX98336.1 hypothetical protein CR157_08455 [Halomonas sp. LBP4]
MSSSAFIRKNFRRTALASVVALGAFGASNSFAADATATATGTVIEPIAITNAGNLNFGQFARGDGGSVTVATDGTRSTTGPILSTTGDTPAAAQFDVTGAADATYSIAWSGDTLLTDSVSTETMALEKISDLTAGGATTGEVAVGVLGTGGTQSIYLGGTLTVAALQAAGTYTGSVTATVEYN